MKVLALDYGAARTGVAVSDPTGTLARPLCVVATRSGLDEVVRVIQEEEPERVVVGHPLTLKGERGEQARATEAFADRLRKAVDVPVDLYDERFTTKLGGDDARAAAHLLESYLAWTSSTT